MNNTKKERNIHQPKPIRHIEVSEKHVGLRIFFFVLFLGIAVASFVVLVTTVLRHKAGWQQVEVNAGSQLNCSDEMVFFYYFEGRSSNVNTRAKALSIVYTQLAIDAYQYFDATAQSDEINNLYYLNHHPNQSVQLQAELYNALQRMATDMGRLMYAAPIQQYIDATCAASDDYEAMLYDPIHNASIRAWAQQAAEYCNNPAHIQLRFLGDNTVCMDISQEYLQFAQQDIEVFVDLCWMRNAFAIDYIANRLLADGYTDGVISSYDGYTRTLHDTQQYNFNIVGQDSIGYTYAGVASYSGRYAVVNWHAYPTQQNEGLVYLYADGKVVHRYFDAADCLCHNSTAQLVALGKDNCVDVAIRMYRYWLCDDLAVDDIRHLSESGIDTVFEQDGTIYYTDSAMQIQVYDGFEAQCRR